MWDRHRVPIRTFAGYEIIFSLKRLNAIFLLPSVQILRWRTTLYCTFAEKKMGIKYALEPEIEGEHPVKCTFSLLMIETDV